MNTHSHQNPHPSVGKHPDRPVHAAPARVNPRPNEEPSDTQAGGFSSILRGYPITLGVTALSALALITAAAFAVYQSPDPTALTLPASAVVLALTALIGGITAGKLNPATPVAASLICGGLTAVLLSLVSLVFEGNGDFIAWAMRLGVIPLHLLGGILTRPRKKTPTHTAGKHPSRR